MFEPEPIPSRPAVPPLAYALAASVVASRWVMGDGLVIAESWPSSLSFLALAGILLLLHFKKPWPVLGCASLACLSCSVAVLLASLQAERVLGTADVLAGSGVSSWVYVVEGDMRESSGGWRSEAGVLAGDARVGSVWLSTPERYARGDVITGVGRFTQNADDEWGRSTRMRGISGSVRLIKVTEAVSTQSPLLHMREALLTALEAESGEGEAHGGRAIAVGAVCGDSAELSALGLDELFAACGASHLVAVSGSHLSLLCAFISAGLLRCGAKKSVKVTLTLAISAAFVIMCGAPPSAVRAWIMSCASSGASLVGRRGHGFSALCVAALAMLLLDPACCGRLGFLLSVLSVAGICLFGEYAKYFVRSLLLAPLGHLPLPVCFARRARSFARSLADAFALAFVCTVFSLPVALPAFGRLSLVGPFVAGLLAVVFEPLMLCGALAALSGGLGPIHEAALGLVDLLGSILVRILEAVSSIPGGSVYVDVSGEVLVVGLLVCSLALFFVWPRVSPPAVAGFCGVACAFFLAWHIRWRYFAPARVCVMDVGQADSILVSDGSSTLLVDAGLDSQVAEALLRNHATHLDAIVLTHLDEDHVGGLDELVGVVSCDAVYVAQGVAKLIDPSLAQSIERLTGSSAHELFYGDSLFVGDFEARMVWPRAEVEASGNAESVVLSLTFSDGGRSLTGLLTGDAEKNETGSVIEAGDVGDIDFLKVGHHGSAVSIDSDEARYLAPEVSVASAGEGNRYRHPRKECVEALEGAGSLFLCTKDAGDVTIEPGANGPVVSCSKSSEGLPGT